MKNIVLIEPKLEEYYYEQKLLSDKDTMSYNAGYDVFYNGYHYNTGCIDFDKDKWLEKYNKRKDKNTFFAYIKDVNLNKYVGYVNYNYNNKENRYECGVVIESKYRGCGYSKPALILLCKQAFSSGIDSLYDSFEKNRVHALKLFQNVGFEIVEEKKWKKFNHIVSGVVVKIERNKFIKSNLTK